MYAEIQLGIIKKDWRNTRDIPVLVVETLAIQDALKQAIQDNYSNI